MLCGGNGVSTCKGRKGMTQNVVCMLVHGKYERVAGIMLAGLAERDNIRCLFENLSLVRKRHESVGF